MRALGLLGCLILPLAACSDGTGATPAAPDAGFGADAPGEGDAQPIGEDAAGGPTYYRDVKAIVDARCVPCHRQDGIGGFALERFEDLLGLRVPIEDAVRSGRMPPWKATEGCNEYSNDRSLAADEKAAVLGWLEAGAPMGDPSEEAPPLVPRDPGLTRVDRRLPVEAPYTPEVGDDYRCFVIDWPDSEPVFVTGFNLAPSVPAIVHHANLYALAPTEAAAFRDRQAADATPGYRCYGGVFANGASLLGSWAPGSHGVEFPRQTGVLVEPGSVVVAEIHFNSAGNEGADRSELLFRVERQVARRAIIVAFWNFFDWPNDGGMPIPAGQADVMHRFEFDPAPYRNIVAPWLGSTDLTIHATGVHMHRLGKSGKVTVVRPDGEDCLVEIASWDFAWQSSYLLTEVTPFVLGRDRLAVECHWDNSAANQPIENGQRRPPRDVEWGTGSDDEMCIGYVLISER